jgi:hypothetical protein
MASTSTQRVEIPQPRPEERTAEPRPVQRPVEKPWTIKVDGMVPC